MMGKMTPIGTTVSFDVLNTHSSVLANVFSVRLTVNTLSNGNGTFYPTINGAEVTVTNSFDTTLIYSKTASALSFSARQTVFHFTGTVKIEITIRSQHNNHTVNGVESAIVLPGLTTTIELTDSTNVIVDVPDTTTQMTIPEVTYVFSAITDAVTEDNGTKYCGTFTDQTLDAGDTGSPCVMGALFTVTLPSDVSALYLHDKGLTASFALQSITTSFVPKRRPTFVKV